MITVPASYTLLANGRNPRSGGDDAGLIIIVNKRKTHLNRIFCDKGPNVKVGKV